MSQRKYNIGLIGLGVMGRNLALNMADNHVAIFGVDADAEKVDALKREGEGKPVAASESIDEMIAGLQSPRTILLLVPAGEAVDDLIEELALQLDGGDIIIDGGNSNFADTDLRCEILSDYDIDFLGLGISGGEKGARHGPSLMPGGSMRAYEHVQRILEHIAAKVDGKPCVAYLGPGSVGHFVKMVHNGIEYGIMQLLAEAYDLMKRTGSTNDEMAVEFAEWNKGEISSFLIEITATVFRKADDETGLPLLDLISDTARGKGTGKWTSQAGMELQAPIPTIDAAVTMRDLSAFGDVRQRLAERTPASEFDPPTDRRLFLDQLRSGFQAAMMLTYAQGFSMLQCASDEYEYNLDLETVSRIWRGGCIIRAALLDEIQSAFQRQSLLPSLLLDTRFGDLVGNHQQQLRNVVAEAVRMRVPVAGMMSALAYYDAFHAQRLPTNLVQAQRDFFGAHTYERIDKPGKFHTDWE